MHLINVQGCTTSFAVSVVTPEDSITHRPRLYVWNEKCKRWIWLCYLECLTDLTEWCCNHFKDIYGMSIKQIRDLRMQAWLRAEMAAAEHPTHYGEARQDLMDWFATRRGDIDT